MAGKRVLTIDDALYIMGHQGKVSVAEAADMMGVSHNYLYRMLSPTDSGANFPVRKLVPAMRAFQNYLPLKVIARDCGFMVFKAPRGVARNAVELTEYQIRFSRLVQLILKYLDQPTYELGQEVLAKLLEHLEDTANWKARVQGDVRQLTIDDILEGEL